MNAHPAAMQPLAPEMDALYDAFAAEFLSRFPTEITRPRIVGREAEFPVITPTGQAADVRRLWDMLMERGDLKPKFDSGNKNLIVGLDGEDYSYALEVGVGTIEVNTRPCADLHTLRHITEEAVHRLVRAALRYGWRVLGYGIQPVSPAHLRLMAPKQRYQSLYRAMGNEWLWYTVTASDQIQIDIARDEALHMLNYGNLMAPVIVALCANSPIYEARLSRFCSGREGRMAQIHASEHRHGIPVRPYTSLRDYIESVSQAIHLILRDTKGGEVLPSSRPFHDYLLEERSNLTEAEAFDAFLFHEHYIWNSARLRVAYGTIELRPACQQPWHEHMAAQALCLGLIEANAPIFDYVRDALGDDYWDVMRSYHPFAIARGLAAPQPAPHFLRRIVTFAEQGLRERGLGEEALLTPIWNRLQRAENPAQHARRVFRTDGLAAVLNQAAIRPNIIR
jgi:gamma-glutamylcysteine synthetase